MTPQDRLLLVNEYNAAKARESFWHFCKVLAPDFYLNDRPHLIILCLTLQSFFEGKPAIEKIADVYDGRIELDSPFADCITWQDADVDTLSNGKVKGTEWSVDLKTTQGKQCKNLAINLPPRFGKSRTLFLFSAWVFGKDAKSMVGTYSYNTKMAMEFSMYTRDTLLEERINPLAVIYEDIFPDTKLKHGNKSIAKWALEGTFFSYMAAGWETGFTGRGFKLMIGDDPIKSSLEAFNQKHLEKMEETYKNSILSRLEKGGLELLNLTRWSKHDLVGINLDGVNGHMWLACKMQAWTESQGMLCDDLLDKERYDYLQSELDPAIFLANYHQEPPDLVGILYKTLMVWGKKPTEFEKVVSYTDTADEGDDFLCTIIGGVYDENLYILDVQYTKEGMEVTEPETAKFLLQNSEKYGYIDSYIESNNGGRGFARAVEKTIDEMERINKVGIEWFHQSENKIARILAHSAFIQRHVFFPPEWRALWPKFHKDLNTYMKEGDNLHDDAPDCLTGLVEKAFTTSTFELYTRYS